MGKPRSIPAKPEHEKLFLDMTSFLAERTKDMPAEEMLAVLCLTVGQVIAWQDQRRFTPETIMELVTANIMEGNARAVAALKVTVGNA